MTVRLSTQESQEAAIVLALSGLHGSDRRTCLQLALDVAPDLSFRGWVASLRQRTPESLAVEYGADAIRAVLALREAYS